MTSNGPRPREHSLTIRKPYLDLIASGAKTIEVRVGYPKIRRFAPGDILTIICADESVTTRITAVREYESFAAMVDAEDAAAIGGPGMTHDQLVAAIRSIYPPEKEALGVFALHLALVPSRA
ncbi:ASCH domain-containing protein [Streptomyces clavuligerus]|uniref:GCN5-related N-acetyltransferase n=1 Tax=Streptomyces clavuligerus TaxID=1901 RepID=E2Q6D7_STRCL|nr:ASCH domain-containing protein [Streptomyces clavuligerus]ANW21984.1 acetyltransferase [Streptomyces clavuligerus]EFG07261.1 GCN5-related N-acetyltransferase [Streptomyces clavuligerus]WDN52245.1 ASCH domain-containing protein [Streptomyces clavuligerus]